MRRLHNTSAITASTAAVYETQCGMYVHLVGSYYVQPKRVRLAVGVHGDVPSFGNRHSH
jgi:hypothetical protein